MVTELPPCVLTDSATGVITTPSAYIASKITYVATLHALGDFATATATLVYDSTTKQIVFASTSFTTDNPVSV